MKKNPGLTVILCVSLVVFAAVAGVHAFAAWYSERSVDDYQYPADGDMNVMERLDACRIPDDTLQKMTDEQLAQAVADYPLLHNVFAYDSLDEGVRNLVEDCDAYRELLSRKKAKEVLLKKAQQLEDTASAPVIVEELKIIMRNEKTWVDSFSKDEMSFLEVSENEVTGYYQYPVTDDMNPRQLLFACRIPEMTVRKMTNRQLAQAVADYPSILRAEVFFNNSSTEDGVEYLKEISDAYRELVSRKNAKEALIEKLREWTDDSVSLTSEECIAIDELQRIVLNEKTFQGSFTEDEMAVLTRKSMGEGNHD